MDRVIFSLINSKHLFKNVQLTLDNLKLEGPEKIFKLPRVQYNISLNNQEGEKTK